MQSINFQKKPTKGKVRNMKNILTLALVAGLTSFAGSAKAAVITTNLNQFTSGNSQIGFGYNNGVITSDYNFGIDGFWQPGYDFGYYSSSAFGAIGFLNGQNAGNGYYNSSNTPLQYGFLINELVSYQTGGPSYIGVNESTGGYWAVKFNAGGGNFNYGYVQVDVTSSGMTFGMAGVETTPNVAITAGAVPEPSALSLLAIGLGGLAILRRRRS
jgi:PEP-CTERM motif